MESINPQINSLHQAYRDATGLTEIPLLMSYERYWHEAVQNGVTPKMVLDVVAYRKKRIAAGIRHEESLKIKNLVGDDDHIGEFFQEWHMLEARRRVRIVDACRASVLAATGRHADYQGVSHGKEAAPANTTQESREVVKKLADEFRRAAE